MKLIVPKYYADFKCIGGLCSDNCCIGWEIDVDPETYKKYEELNSPLGEKIRKNTVITDGVCSFVMNGERCPHLNSQNLCDIICEMGEGWLCEICREHPRYYTTLGDTVFGGVGLSCEEAAKLVLTSSFPHEYIELETECEYEECDEELFQIFLGLRKEILNIFGDGKQSLLYIITKLKIAFLQAQARADGEAESSYEIRDFSRDNIVETMERSELLTDELLRLLKKAPCRTGRKFKSKNVNIYLQNILLYFLDRYLPKAVEDGDFLSKLNIALFSVYTLELLFSAEENFTIDRAVYLSKLYSKEIEYNEENIEFLNQI